MWRRKRVKPSYEEMLAEAREGFAGMLDMADDSLRMTVETFETLTDMRAAVEELLDEGAGLPARSIRARLPDVEDLRRDARDRSAEYEKVRVSWREGADEADFESLTPAAEYLTEYISSCVPTMERLNELINGLGDLYATLAELLRTLTPIRERAHAALSAAAGELAWAGPATQGKFALEVRLNAIGDRLRALDAGVVDLEPDREVADRYYEVEAAIAEIREATLLLGPAY
ncbi:hypothetical protein [Streptomyces sp. C36]|uniref:hypothetical protein n=1 Tax=Streptomyces sp. C36 TaxID=3237122 RepID=UPI0034C5E750